MSPPTNSSDVFSILVVDDDPDMRRVICTIVNSIGQKAVELDHAREAIPAIERGHGDLLLLDIKMPGVSGLDLLKVIRRRMLPIPVIIVSGFISQDVAHQLTELNVQGIVAKPFKKERFQAEIERVLGLGAS